MEKILSFILSFCIAAGTFCCAAEVAPLAPDTEKKVNYLSQQVTSGNVDPEQVTPGDVEPGQVTPGDVDPGQVTPGDVDPGQVTPGDVDPEPQREFEYTVSDGNAIITDYNGGDKEIMLPDVIDGYAVTGIADFAFADSSAEKITVPASVDGISENAFLCGTLSEISVDAENENYASVDGVLYNKALTVLIKCPQAKTESVMIPETVIVISSKAFYMSALGEIALPDSVTAIGDFAFAYSAVTSVSLPDFVTSVGDNAFSGCAALESAVLPASLEAIPEAMFSDCVKLTEITVPQAVVSIGSEAFCNTAIKDYVYIPATVKEIGDRAFGYCFENDAEFVKCEGFVIRGEKGSAAEEYAAANGFEFFNTLLDTPELIEAAAENSGVTLYWNAVERADGYIVYRKVNGGSWARLTEVSADEKTVYCDFSVKGGNVYTYTVRASLIGYLSAYDKAGVSAECIKLPVPVLESATVGSAGITVTWQNIPAAKNYTLYKRTASSKWYEIAEFGAGTVSYTDTSVTNGITYYYTLTASRGDIISGYDPQGVSAVFLKGEPKLTGAVNDVYGVTVSWNAVSGSEKYIVYRRTAGASWVKLATVSGKTLKYTDKTAVGGNTYIYTVASVFGGARGLYNKTGISCKYIETPKPVIKCTSEGLNISWAKCAGAKRYRIYRMGADGKWVKLATSVSADITSFNDRSVQSGKKYTYTVKSLNGSLSSSFVKAGVSTLYLAQPTPVSAKSTAYGVAFKWNKVAGAANYYVYRRTAGGSWVRIAVVKNSFSGYVDKTAVKGKTYVYTVKAVNGSYSSTYNSGLVCKAVY